MAEEAAEELLQQSDLVSVEKQEEELDEDGTSASSLFDINPDAPGWYESDYDHVGSV